MELKKSYGGIVLWMVLFVVAMSLSTLLPLEENLLSRIGLNIMTIGMTILTFIIYVTGNIYWYNGVSYEEAVAVGYNRRKIYAFRHFIRFGVFTAIFLVFSVIMQVINAPWWVDSIVVSVGLIATAISTMWIKL